MAETGKRKVTIVENDSDMLFILGEVLRDAGYVVEKFRASSGLADHNQMPDLFILGEDFSANDGLTLCRLIRTSEKMKGIPVIVISAYPIHNKAKQAGADAFVSKPFELNYLLGMIRKQLERKKPDIVSRAVVNAFNQTTFSLN